jgi:hypothetical protein
MQRFIDGAAFLQSITHGLLRSLRTRKINEMEVPVFGGFDSIAELL